MSRAFFASVAAAPLPDIGPYDEARANARLDDVAAMRQRLFEDQKMRGPLDVKNGPGGPIDIEFLAQALILAYAADCPAIIVPRGLAASLEELQAADLLSRGDYELLLETGSYYGALRQISGLCLEPDSDTIGQGATEMELNAVQAPDVARLQAQLEQFREDVSASSTRLMAALRRIDGSTGAG